MGSAYACRALLPHLKSRRSGKIINISGGGATRPLPGMSAYAASKAALVRFTETLAEEVSSFGIDVNAVAPGTLATRLLDEVVAAGPEKVGAAYHDRISRARAEGGTSLEVPAALCVYLASGESDVVASVDESLYSPTPIPGREAISVVRDLGDLVQYSFCSETLKLVPAVLGM